jgi:hypothetical protein
VDVLVPLCVAINTVGVEPTPSPLFQECVQFVTSPELLVTLLCVEALEDNEVVIVENVIQVGKLSNVRLKPDFEPRKSSANTVNKFLLLMTLTTVFKVVEFCRRSLLTFDLVTVVNAKVLRSH